MGLRLRRNDGRDAAIGGAMIRAWRWVCGHPALCVGVVLCVVILTFFPGCSPADPGQVPWVNAGGFAGVSGVGGAADAGPSGAGGAADAGPSGAGGALPDLSRCKLGDLPDGGTEVRCAP